MTLFDNILEHTKVEFVTSRAPKSDKDTVTVAHQTSDGLAINVQESAIKSLQMYNSYDNEKDMSRELQNMFRIHTISVVGLKHTAIYALVIKLLAEKTIYGLTLIDVTGDKYNVGNCFTSIHPSMPFSKLIVYSYVDTDSSIIDSKLEEFTALACKLFAISKEASYNRKEKPSSSVSIRNQNQSNSNFLTQNIHLDTKSSVVLPATEASEHILVPQLFVCRGIHYPYYGVSIINIKDGNRYGKSVTPFLSANISDDRESKGSVCTGSLPSDKFDSLRSLNDCNLDSPYRRRIMPDIATTKTWVKANKLLTIKLLQERIDNASTDS